MITFGNPGHGIGRNSAMFRQAQQVCRDEVAGGKGGPVIAPGAAKGG
jgi:hypothetical protein